MLENDGNSEQDGGYIDCEFGNGDALPFGQHVERLENYEAWLCNRNTDAVNYIPKRDSSASFAEECEWVGTINGP